jgi:hypothetical protein
LHWILFLGDCSTCLTVRKLIHKEWKLLSMCGTLLYISCYEMQRNVTLVSSSSQPSGLLFPCSWQQTVRTISKSV